MTKVIETTAPVATENLGKHLGSRLKGGAVIELVSDLGGGKTTMTRGIVEGAGSQDLVTSPTFTISNRYQVGKLSISHFDFYRLVEPGLMEHELADVLEDPSVVVIVEWSEIVAHVLPKDRLTIEIVANSEDGRKITMNYPEKLSYLVDGL